MINARKVYDRLFLLLEKNTTSFDLISKSANKDADLTRIYLAISNTEKNHLIGTAAVDISLFDIYIHSNTRYDDTISGSERLLDLVEEVQYALAKPVNYDVMHMGLPGIVFDMSITGIDFYDDAASGDENVIAIVTVQILHATDVFEKGVMTLEY